MKIIGHIEQLPEDMSGSAPSQVRELSMEAETYEKAVAGLRDQVPDGWRLMNLRRGSD
ncbi:hypothetical protein [Microbacterium sp. A93]|uniref:hypothetical protein n=1 Tax=Microbacterium sp. A93 TaxID=3450716 RepID=UPI003F43B5FD